jgi:hypothetical protein
VARVLTVEEPQHIQNMDGDASFKCSYADQKMQAIETQRLFNTWRTFWQNRKVCCANLARA